LEACGRFSGEIISCLSAADCKTRSSPYSQVQEPRPPDCNFRVCVFAFLNSVQRECSRSTPPSQEYTKTSGRGPLPRPPTFKFLTYEPSNIPNIRRHSTLGVRRAASPRGLFPSGAARAAILIHQRGLPKGHSVAALRAQVADLHYFFNPKYIRANRRIVFAIASASCASSRVG